MAFCSLGEAALLGVSFLPSCLFSSVFGQYNFTLPMQDGISSVSLTHYCSLTPCPPRLCVSPSCLLFPRSPPYMFSATAACPRFLSLPNHKAHYPSHTFPDLQGSPCFRLFPSNSACITSPPVHQYVLHCLYQYPKITFHFYNVCTPHTAIFSTFPLSTTSPASFSLAFQPDKGQGCPECWGDVSPLLG